MLSAPSSLTSAFTILQYSLNWRRGISPPTLTQREFHRPGRWVAREVGGAEGVRLCLPIPRPRGRERRVDRGQKAELTTVDKNTAALFGLQALAGRAFSPLAPPPRPLPASSPLGYCSPSIVPRRKPAAAPVAQQNRPSAFLRPLSVAPASLHPAHSVYLTECRRHDTRGRRAAPFIFPPSRATSAVARAAESVSFCKERK